MGRLKLLTILLTLAMWGATTDGAPQNGAAPRTGELPPGVKAGDYVQAVAKLCNAGKADKAGPYFQAALDFSDMLTPEERATLARYEGQVRGVSSPAPASRAAAPEVVQTSGTAGHRDAVGATPQATASAAPDPRDRALSLLNAARQAMAAGQMTEARRMALEAQSLNVPFAVEEDNPARVLAEIERAGAGPLARAAVVGDAKQQATWLLRSAREQMGLGNYDHAAQLIAQAKSMNVRWTLFDETPTKVEADLAKARPRTQAPETAMDRKAAKTRLKEARDALDAGDYEKAEAVAMEVNSWGLSFGVIEDNPNKVISAARVMRKRGAARRGSSLNQSEDLYNTLVQQARQDMAAGHWDDAEAKARKALTMSVVPALTADRAETVLNDIVSARSGAAFKSDPQLATASGESASAAAERQANELLAQNKTEEARAKFEQAEQLRAREMGLPADDTPAPLLGPATLASNGGAPQDPFSQEPAPVPVGNAPAQLGAARVGQEPVGSDALDLMEQSRALMAAGNFRAARESAERALKAGAGLEAESLLAQIDQTRQQAALSLYEAALDGIRKGELERSRALLTELNGQDLDETTQQKVQDLLMRLPRNGQDKSKLQAIEDAEAVRIQQINVEVGTKMGEARHLLEVDPAKAITILEQEKNVVQAAGLSEAVTRTMTRRLEVAIELAKKDKLVFDEKIKDKAFREENERKRLRMIEAGKAKQERTKEYMEKAMEAQAHDDWVTAEKYAKLAQAVDPNDIAATALAFKARVARRMERDLRNKQDLENGAAETFQLVDEASIPDPEVQSRGIKYPVDWNDLTKRRRDTMDRLAYKKSMKTIEIERRLDEPITLPNSDQMTLSEALKYLGEYTGLNIMMDREALAEEGLTDNTPVNISRVSNVKLKTVLKWMLRPLHMSYTVEDDLLLITSPTANKKRMFPKVYDVADLVISPHRKNGAGGNMVSVPPPGMASTNDANVLQAQAAAMMGNGAGSAPAAPNLTTGGWGAAVGEREVDFTPLIQLIKTSIAPGTWSNDHTPADVATGDAYGMGQGFGGAGLGGGAADQAEGVGSITPFFLNISLIIRQTAEVHEEIVELLRQLRHLQDLQVSIEVRFITVSDDFFELIGVDFDFDIQSDAIGRKSSFAVPNAGAGNLFPGATTGGNTANTATTPYLFNPIRDHTIGRAPLTVGLGGATTDLTTPNFQPNLAIPFTQNTIDAITPFNAVPNVAANFGIAFLSDLEVFLFMTAIQGDRRSNIVQAPKVTSFNGAPASVVNFRGENYVSSLIPIIGAGAVAFQPNIQTFPDGVQFFVTPVVSADRRYVRMSLSPFFTTLEGFDTFSIPAAVGGGGLGGQSSTINAQVMLPRFTIANVTTTVTVPDGGTVLLGGVKRLREERAEFGVPILSKTPLIDRLFRNVGIGRNTTSLMLMVTPRIIILEEEEERLAAPALSNVTFSP